MTREQEASFTGKPSPVPLVTQEKWWGPKPRSGSRRTASLGGGTTRSVATESAPKARGSYLTLEQAAEAYPVFTFRLLRRLVDERRIAFSRAGRRIVLAECDIEQYLEANRVEPQGQSRAS